MLVLLAGVLGFGGLRRLRKAYNARRSTVRLESADVTPSEIEAAASHGRAGLMELFRLLGEGKTEPVRHAAGYALSVLWASDELIGEEEKAIVRRGYQVRWLARRRYPRALDHEIPIAVEFGVPFLRSHEEGVPPEKLEWSYRVEGTRRASLGTFSEWVAGPGRAEFSVFPGDFDGPGPHRLVFQSRVRTVGLTDSWELELPHIPFQFELDPRLEPGSIFALQDETRGTAVSKAVELVAASDPEGPQYLPLSALLALASPLALQVAVLPDCDLAHRVELEFEGLPPVSAGTIVAVGQGGTASVSRRFPVGAIDTTPGLAIDRPGIRRLRARLTAEPGLGWTHPDVRSVWPGVVETGWVDVEVVRR